MPSVQAGADGEAQGGGTGGKRWLVQPLMLWFIHQRANDPASSQGTEGNRRQPNYLEVTAQAEGDFCPAAFQVPSMGVNVIIVAQVGLIYRPSAGAFASWVLRRGSEPT